MIELKRRYIYEDTYSKVLEWGRRMKQMGVIDRPTNRKDNFPYYLEKYIEVNAGV